jgi:hypothetical protein
MGIMYTDKHKDSGIHIITKGPTVSPCDTFSSTDMFKILF